MNLGERLKEAREAKSLTLDDLQKITKIQTRYLQAIERGNYEVMPGNFYIRAFIKEYATAVDLDPEQLMEEYQNDLPTSSDERSIQYSRVQRSKKDTTSSTKSPAIFSFLPTILFVILILGILVVVWYFSQGVFTNDDNEEPGVVDQDNDGGDKVTLPPNQTETDENDDSNGANEGEDSESEEQQPENSEEETVEPSFTIVEQGTNETTYDFINPDDKVEVELSTDKEHWVELENGKGKSFYSAMFFADDSPLQQDMTGEEQIYLRFGESEDLTITINGVKLELPEDIDPAQVQRVWINIKNEEAE
ncbi:helix-turn-helix domain-containing protein [Aquibacillus koreensis]|uniref:Helix-turn-helix domain-containing protein n=1 Tax=Aquibacillus koreensis TaxID=279446 RepID=A0A9X3WN53_9BACI|nr:helix-turn-helix domain-containing protein [Aquibacillus koreensis]MCT2534593.1 helix-turn-helix domain-containing protein [Aquibacillus koreensis]MDC3421813.1 helix-turn-helix domain-containing protein [Aquibacillus koreensis]